MTVYPQLKTGSVKEDFYNTYLICGCGAEFAASRSGAQGYQYLLGLPDQAPGVGAPVKWLTFCRYGTHAIHFLCASNLWYQVSNL
jgi:hypothetical protein